jgi:Histidine kinase-, DNA gyrase B-, and HSP90-like ATPase
MRRTNSDEVYVNVGNMLEAQLERWRGGRSHGRGIAEYITNCDDSYRRLKKFSDQKIEVEIHSRRGRHIDKVIIRDFAEGMSLNDFENKFFLYFESASGRDQGALVSGQFGTGGKAYAIMNFHHCWITSAKDGLENKAWFKWDPKRKKILRDYTKGGYRNKRVKKPNQTVVELEDSIKSTQDLMELVLGLERLPRIRHVLKNQKVSVRLHKKSEDETVALEYTEPRNPLKTWQFPVPKQLQDGEKPPPMLTLRYFQRPLDRESFIDVTDSISSVADLDVSRYDGRPFSKYFNGSLTLKKLLSSSAVKENRKGLEEGDDLTDAIEGFFKDCVYRVVTEVEEEQRKKERERRLSASNAKMQELSKFLKRCELNFKRELRELKKRCSITNHPDLDEDEDSAAGETYRKPTADDPPEALVRGRWIEKIHEGNGTRTLGSPVFVPDEKGDDFAVRIGSRTSTTTQPRKVREGLRVLMSDDPNLPEEHRPIFGEFDDPVSDRDMLTKGIIWINANHPRIVERRTKSENDPVFLEMVANYVLIVVAQHQVQKQYEAEPDEEKSDPMLLFRQRLFKLQRDLIEDEQITYFESDGTVQSDQSVRV